MKVKGFGFQQNGVTLYLALVKAKDLVAKAKVDIWSKQNQDGYQRECTLARARAFSRFIAAGNYSPCSLLINVRGATLREVNGQLELPDDVEFWIVDGQHRQVGIDELIKVAQVYSDLEIPSIFMNTSSKYEEAKQFVIINRTQKGVRQDLAERFLQKAVQVEGREALLVARDKGVLRAVLRGLEWKTVAIEIADTLDSKPGSTWYKRIYSPGEPKTVVSQKSFTDSLEPALKKLEGKKASDIAALLDNFWSTLKDLCPEPFDMPDEYQIQRTHGVFSLHDLLPSVIEHCGLDAAGRRVLTKSGFNDVLKYLGSGIKPEYWRNDGTVGLRGTGKKSFRITALELKDFLERGIGESKESDWVV